MAPLHSVTYTTRALAYVKTLQPKIRKQIIEKVQTLASKPHPATAKLVQGRADGTERVYRLRSGDYRILYVVRTPIIIVLDIGHRKDVYR